MIRPILKTLIQCYRVTLRPMFPASCRFHPSCSEYALASLDRLPVFSALGRIVLRLSKCHPYHPGGHDPVP